MQKARSLYIYNDVKRNFNIISESFNTKKKTKKG